VTDTARPLISCMMATRGRDGLLQRAVRCFQEQAYAPLELVVVHDSDDEKTPVYFRTLGDARIRVFAAAPGIKLGAIRNMLVQESRGEFIAQWDDDDWYAPNRLLEQMRAIETSGKDACLLSRITIVDGTDNRVFLSFRRPWEGNILVRKSALPRYDDSLPMREDTPVVHDLVRRKAVAFLDRPDLYVYVYHAANTWDRGHWERNVMAKSTLIERGLAGVVLDKLK
jgi:glycosyltransferase involved in cell wall biosynthesis